MTNTNDLRDAVDKLGAQIEKVRKIHMHHETTVDKIKAEMLEDIHICRVCDYVYDDLGVKKAMQEVADHVESLDWRDFCDFVRENIPALWKQWETKACNR